MKIQKPTIRFYSAREAFIAELAKSKKNQKLYLKIAFEDYRKDHDLPALLLALRTIAIASGGIMELAEKTNLHRQTIYKALSAKGNPSFVMMEAILGSFDMELRVS